MDNLNGLIINRITISLILLLLITSFGILTTFSPLYGNLFVNIIPLLFILTCLPLMLFAKIKLATLLFGRILILVTYIGFFPETWCINLVIALLFINILEAVLFDLKAKQFINGINGILIAISCIMISMIWKEKFPYVISDYFIFWVIGYTIWNLNFVSHIHSPSITFLHCIILISPLLILAIFRDPGLYVIVRANTLTFGGIIQWLFIKKTETYFMSNAVVSFINFINKKVVQIGISVLVISCITLFLIK